MKKIVITGATSFLGAATVKKFLEKGHMVYAVVRKETKNLFRLKEHCNLRIVESNLNEIENLTNDISNADIFCHFAWDGSGSVGRSDQEIQKSNYEFAMNAVQCALRMGCELFVFPGSQAEYGKMYDFVDEHEECNPVSEYGKYKLKFGIEAAELLKNQKCDFLHLRIFSVYGSNDRPNTLIDSCIKTFSEGGTVFLGDCLHFWNYLYIEDFTYILYELVKRHILKRDLEGIYNIAGIETKQLRWYVEKIYEISDKKGIFQYNKCKANAEGSPSLMPNISKLEKTIDLSKLKQFEIGINEMIEEKYGKKCIVCEKRLGNSPIFKFTKMPSSAQNIPTYEELETDSSINLNLYQCEGCGLVQFDCEPVNYYKDVIRAGGISTTMTELRRKQYSHLIEKYGLQGKNFIEVGCGQGEFLNVLKEFPVNGYGIEHKEDLVKLAQEKGLTVTQGFITDSHIIEDGKMYDCFLSFNFLEHQPEPNKMLQAIYNKLNDGGMGLITVPSFEYILQCDGYYELIRDHIAYYTFDTLKFLLEKNGFDVLEEEMVNRDTLSVIVVKRKKVNLKHWEERINLIKQEFYGFIDEHKRNNKKLAIWGASHQGFTIVSNLELGNDIEYIIDSAVFKQGKFSPGSHVKIVAPEIFYNAPCDTVIIVAPGYTDEIKRNIDKNCKKHVDVYTLRSEHIEKL